MEDIISKIISMDKETVKIKKKTEEIVISKEKELKETIQNLENKYLEEGRLEGEKRYIELIESARREVELLQEKEEKVINNIEKIYKEKKQSLIEELIHSLLG